MRPSQPNAGNSLADRVVSVAAGAHVVGAGFLAGAPAFALADGTLLLAGADERRVAAHPDAAILVADAGDGYILAGGDDGRVTLTGADGVARMVGEERGKWIDAVARAPSGALAWSAGRTVRATDGKGETKSFEAPSSVRGLAFFPKGFRIAAAHYNGVSLWFPNTAAKPEYLEWKGSHLDAAVSPDGKFVITSMQENTLHGWRLADQKHMRMSGYPAKTRSLSWSHNGEWLATSGAEASVIWPFQTKEGPMGRGPRECGVRPKKVTRVAFHPASLVLAIGYEDGWIILCRLSDGAELFVRGPREGKDAVSALAWDAAGKRLAFGTQEGAAGVLTLP